MSSAEQLTDFWKEHWENQAKIENDLHASGWGPREAKEYLNDLNDVAQKLELCASDRLLNVGCGAGLMEIIFGHWVAHIDSVDYSKGMVERAAKNNEMHNNVRVQHGSILDLSFLDGKYTKVLANSVIQYLQDMDELRKAFESIASVCDQNARVLISANPDIRKQEEFLKGYDKLDLTEEQKIQKKEANKKNLWTNPDDLIVLAKDLGFNAEIQKMNEEVWQSWYMFDLLLWR